MLLIMHKWVQKAGNVVDLFDSDGQVLEVPPVYQYQLSQVNYSSRRCWIRQNSLDYFINSFIKKIQYNQACVVIPSSCQS